MGCVRLPRQAPRTRATNTKGKPERMRTMLSGTEDTMPTTVQWIYMVAEAMGRQDNVEVVEMPDEIAAPFRPLNQGENDGLRGPHIHFNEKAHRLLGYKDVVGKREAIKTTADWMVRCTQAKLRTARAARTCHAFDFATSRSQSQKHLEKDSRALTNLNAISDLNGRRAGGEPRESHSFRQDLTAGTV